MTDPDIQNPPIGADPVGGGTGPLAPGAPTGGPGPIENPPIEDPAGAGSAGPGTDPGGGTIENPPIDDDRHPATGDGPIVNPGP